MPLRWVTLGRLWTEAAQTSSSVWVQCKRIVHSLHFYKTRLSQISDQDRPVGLWRVCVKFAGSCRTKLDGLLSLLKPSTALDCTTFDSQSWNTHTRLYLCTVIITVRNQFNWQACLMHLISLVFAVSDRPVWGCPALAHPLLHHRTTLWDSPSHPRWRTDTASAEHHTVQISSFTFKHLIIYFHTNS